MEAPYHPRSLARRGWVSRPLAGRINRRSCCLFGLRTEEDEGDLYIATISTDTLSYSRPLLFLSALGFSDLNRREARAFKRLVSTGQAESEEEEEKEESTHVSHTASTLLLRHYRLYKKKKKKKK